MTKSLLNFAANQRVDLAEFNRLAQTQPTALAAADAGTFLCRAAVTSEMWVLHGFAATANVQLNTNSPAANQLSVSPGSGLLAWRQGGDAPLFGVLAALDGSDQQAQGLDLSINPSGPYAIWVRLNDQQAALADRTFWNAADPGFEFSRNTRTELRATWEVQLLGAALNPGAEWLKVATLTWTAPATQGGSGTISALVDQRPLYFEGSAATATPYATTWGSAADRSANRGSAGVYDLRTMLDALRTCIEDIKGPGLRRWWEAGVGGINVGFGANAPVANRIALGDASFYLQGRTTGDSRSYFVVNKNLTTGAYDGLMHDTPTNTARWMLQTGFPLLTMNHRRGTLGAGPLADIDLEAMPGRAVMEIVASNGGQQALRLGTRAFNGAQPVALDTVLGIYGPDQSGNVAQVLFGTGGVVGPERLLYRLGKGTNNNFHLFDSVNNGLVLDYATASRSLTLTAGAFVQFDATNSVAAMSYTTANRTTLFSGNLTVGTGLTVNGGASFNGSASFGGTFNVTGGGSFGQALSAATLTTTGAVSAASLSATGSVSGASLSITNTATATQGLVVGGTKVVYANCFKVPESIGAPPGRSEFGLLYYDPQRKRLYAYTQGALENDAPTTDLGPGWKAIA